MVQSFCLCGQVRISVSKRPEFVNECNCTLCAKTGARWGYFGPSEVAVEGETWGYRRGDKAEANAEVHFCPHCGSTTHFVLTEAAVARFGNVQMGVNMAMAEEADLAGVELRFPDGRAWSGEGADFGFVREAQVLGAD